MSDIEDLTGKIFGNWEVKRFVGFKQYSKARKALWECQCVINPEIIIQRDRQQLMKNVMPNICHKCDRCLARDLTNQQFGELTVLSQAQDSVAENGRHYKMWHCRCSCGNEKDFYECNLIGGKSKSCGCVSRQKMIERTTTHGMTNTRIYRIWENMRKRCRNHNDPRFHRYGGRGIKVCDEWNNDFLSFYNWAIENGYEDYLTIDRIDNNGMYCPDNCRWTDIKTQCKNRSTNIWVEIDGEMKIVSDWAELYGLDRDLIYRRISVGWDPKRAILEQIHKASPIIMEDKMGAITKFKSVQEAANYLNISDSAIRLALTNKHNTCHGCTWRYDYDVANIKTA